jgi:hypothetical protein
MPQFPRSGDKVIIKRDSGVIHVYFSVHMRAIPARVSRSETAPRCLVETSILTFMNWPSWAWNEGNKILVTALAASFFTACITEPVKAWLQGLLQRRRVRRWLYREMIHNCSALSAWVQSAALHAEMQKHTAVQFASEYRRLAYDLAVKDAGFYSLRGDEPYRIDTIYREFERISQGAYEDAHDCFLRAQVAAASVLHGMKDRSLSKRVAFSVSSAWQRKYFRENLPRTPYINFDNPPCLRERLYRRYDALRYWVWR